MSGSLARAEVEGNPGDLPWAPHREWRRFAGRQKLIAGVEETAILGPEETLPPLGAKGFAMSSLFWTFVLGLFIISLCGVGGSQHGFFVF